MGEKGGAAGITGKPEQLLALNCGGDDRDNPARYFAPKLHETDVWDEELYWQLDKCVVELGARYGNKPMPKKIIRDLMHVYNYIHGRLNYHRMACDQSSIKNFSDEDCRSWAERVEFVFTAAISGFSIRNNLCERINPLLSQDGQ